MKQKFGRTVPDVVGFAVVGATAGAVLLGGADHGMTVQSALGCLLGGTIAPVLLMTSWTRLMRLRLTTRPFQIGGLGFQTPAGSSGSAPGLS